METHQRTSGGARSAWSAFNHLRACHRELGLSSCALRTLQAVLSFLADPSRPIIHASNRTLSDRAAISERSLRRHLQELEALGLIARKQSANGKRFRLCDPCGDGITFGIDVTPFLARAQEFTETAESQAREAARRHVLRHHILARLRALAEAGTPCPDEAGIRTALRRKLAIDALEEMFDGLPQLSESAPEPSTLTATDSQNDRHQQKTMKEDLLMKGNEAGEPERGGADGHGPAAAVTVAQVKEMCPDALSFCPEPVQTLDQLWKFAWWLGSMIGIGEKLLHAAASRHGLGSACLAVLAIVQRGARIRNPAGYFRAVLLGDASSEFCPQRMLRSLPGSRPAN